MPKKVYAISCAENIWTKVFDLADISVCVRLVAGMGQLALETAQPTGDNSGNSMPLTTTDQYVDFSNDQHGWFKPSFDTKIAGQATGTRSVTVYVIK